VILYFYH